MITTVAGSDALGFAERISAYWRRWDTTFPIDDVPVGHEDYESMAMYRREREDERARTAAALTAANLTPVTPEPGVWVALGTWRPDWMTPLRVQYPTLAEAQGAAMRAGCMAGIRLARVAGPDGRIHALWDKDAAGSLWLEITPEAAEAAVA